MKIKHLTTDLATRKSNSTEKRFADIAQLMLDRCFKQQVDFILDRSRYKSALCARRSGKTYACVTLLCRQALLRPDSKILYLALTSGQAKRNVWGTFQKLNKDFELGIKFHETNLTLTLSNGSVVQISGAETRKECEKFRGQYFDLVVIDEGKSFNSEIVKELIFDILKPALADNLGTLAMIGTPGNVLAGVFYEATTPECSARRFGTPWTANKFWSFHNWHTSDNIAMPHIWDDALDDKKLRNIDDTDPTWVREWLGQWCPSESLMVYRYAEERNGWTPPKTRDNPHGLPEGHEWKFLFGMDLGFNDSTAIVVAAYSDTYPDLLQIYEWKAPHQTFQALLAKVKEVIRKFGEFDGMVADTGGLGKLLVESLNAEGFHIEAAEKREKFDHIELVNSDLLAGRIKVISDGYLANEMLLLQWKDESFTKEDKATDNHACDAFLYTWRYAYHHFWKKPQNELKKGSQSWYEAKEAEEVEAYVRSQLDAQSDDIDQLFGDFALDGDWVH